MDLHEDEKQLVGDLTRSIRLRIAASRSPPQREELHDSSDSKLRITFSIRDIELHPQNIIVGAIRWHLNHSGHR